MAENNNNNNDNKNGRLKQWHQSFAGLSDEEEEEDLEDDDDVPASRNNRNMNRSFVDFLFAGTGNAAAANRDPSPQNSLVFEDDAFELVPEAPVVPQSVLADSFIARSYPTSSVLRGSVVAEYKPLLPQPQQSSPPSNDNDTTDDNKKKSKKKKSKKIKKKKASKSQGNSDSSFDILSSAPAPAPQTNSSVSSLPPINNNVDTANNSQELQQSMNLSQVFNASLQRQENYMPPPVPKSPKPPKQEAAPTPMAEKKAASQRELWQQSLANDCLALDPPADTPAAPDKNKEDLGTTAHTRESVVDADVDAVKDDASKMSDSYHDEGSDSIDPAQQKEREVRNSLCMALLTALGIMCLMHYIRKCLQCCCNEKQEEEEVAAGADAIGGDPAGAATNPTGGNGNPPVAQTVAIQQMAVAASQNAAASAAQGGQAAASASTATAGSAGTAGMVAVGVLAAGAAVAVGTTMAVRGMAGGLWTCDPNQAPLTYPGNVILYLQGIQDPAWFSDPTRRALLEDAFVEVFNEVGGMCQSTYQRVLESATLNQDDWEGLKDDKGVTYYRTNWTASVLCNGDCPELEPLFYIRAYDYQSGLYGYSSLNQTNPPKSTSSTPSPAGSPVAVAKSSRHLRGSERRLQSQGQGKDPPHEAWFLLAFASNFTQALTTIVATNGSNTENVIVFDGYTLSPLDGSLVERIGTSGEGSPFSTINVTKDILDETGSASSQRPLYDDAIPQCPAKPTQVETTGFLHMMVENLDCQELLTEKSSRSELENFFRAVYNRVGNGCQGKFERVMQLANLTNCTSMRANSTDRGNVFYAEMDWNAVVKCDGCATPEPIFLESYSQRLRRLKETIFLEKFVHNLTLALESVPGNGNKELNTLYAETLSTRDMQTIVEFTGKRLVGVPVAAHPTSNIFHQNPSDSSKLNSTSGPNQGTDQDIQPCEAEAGEVFSYKKGRVRLMIENVSPELMDLEDPGNHKLLEDHFKTAYNNVSGMCEGEFKRIVHNATLLNYTFETRGDGVPYIDTMWIATVSCSGCDDSEPLFLDNQAVTARALEADVSSMLGMFSLELGQTLDTDIRLTTGGSSRDWKPIVIFYLETLPLEGNEVKQIIGYHPQYYVNSGGGGGASKPSGQGSNPPGTSNNPGKNQIQEKCIIDLNLVDTNFDNMLDQKEYVKFVHKLIAQVNPSLDMQEVQRFIPSFDSLPPSVKQGFILYAAGGEIPIYGDKEQEDAPVEQMNFLWAFCNGTARLIQDEFGEDTSVVGEATDRPTPTNSSPTNSSPPVGLLSQPPSNSSNSQIPSSSHTTAAPAAPSSTTPNGPNTGEVLIPPNSTFAADGQTYTPHGPNTGEILGTFTPTFAPGAQSSTPQGPNTSEIVVSSTPTLAPGAQSSTPHGPNTGEILVSSTPTFAPGAQSSTPHGPNTGEILVSSTPTYAAVVQSSTAPQGLSSQIPSSPTPTSAPALPSSTMAPGQSNLTGSNSFTPTVAPSVLSSTPPASTNNDQAPSSSTPPLGPDNVQGPNSSTPTVSSAGPSLTLPPGPTNSSSPNTVIPTAQEQTPVQSFSPTPPLTPTGSSQQDGSGTSSQPIGIGMSSITPTASASPAFSPSVPLSGPTIYPTAQVTTSLPNNIPPTLVPTATSSAKPSDSIPVELSATGPPTIAVTLSATAPPTTAVTASTSTLSAPPSAPPVTASPAPSMSPTVPTEILDMVYQLKFYVNYSGFEDREPTPEEYEGLRVSLETYFFHLIETKYKDSQVSELTNHDLALLETKYIPNPTVDRYTHSLTFASNFTFEGEAPPIRELFDVYNTMSLQELTEQGVWSAEPLGGVFYYTAGILWTNGRERSGNDNDLPIKEQQVTQQADSPPG